MQEENKTAEGEGAGEEKKEGKISGFFKKIGKKIDDAAYDSRLASDFAKKNIAYKVFTVTGLLSPSPEISAEEHLDGEEKYILMYGTDENIKPGCLIKRNNDRHVYHITEVSPATLTIEFEGKSNEKPALKIVLGEEAQKVNVIKAGDDFYLV